jgi:hypothetical protein
VSCSELGGDESVAWHPGPRSLHGYALARARNRAHELFGRGSAMVLARNQIRETARDSWTTEG